METEGGFHKEYFLGETCGMTPTNKSGEREDFNVPLREQYSKVKAMGDSCLTPALESTDQGKGSVNFLAM